MRYPDSPRPVSPYPFRNNRPFVLGGPDWAPQSRALTVFGLFECDLTYKGRTPSDVLQLYNFYDSIGGAAGRFTFVDFNGAGPVGGVDPGMLWSALYVGTADGATGSWDAPTFGAKASTTTVVASLVAGTRTVTPVSMAGIWNPANYSTGVGTVLTIVNSDGTAGELVTVTAVTATTFTAIFANNHGANFLVNAPIVFENGVAKTTAITGSPGAGTYGLVAGTGTDGVDTIVAGTDPTAGVIVTVAAMCRRALRRARFTTPKQPFVLNVPQNYQQDLVTIVEVRK